MAGKGDSPIRKMVVVPPAMWAEISDYRFAEKMDTETEAIRRLIERGLDAERARKSASGSDPR